MQEDIRRTLAHIDRFDGVLNDHISQHSPTLHLTLQKVSHWSVGNHFEHVLMVNDLIADKLLGHDTTGQTTSGINLIGRIVLLTGFIPRGRGKAPKNLIPKGVEGELLREMSARNREKLKQIDNAIDSIREDKVRFTHPVFGGLHKMQWLRFMEIHTRHHWKIVSEVLKAASA